MPVFAKVIIGIWVTIPSFLISWIIISYFIWRKKYYDKKTGWNKCGVCGKTPSDIYFVYGVYFKKYHCLEHSKDNHEKSKTKN